MFFCAQTYNLGLLCDAPVMLLVAIGIQSLIMLRMRDTVLRSSYCKQRWKIYVINWSLLNESDTTFHYQSTTGVVKKGKKLLS